jgi:hypothetical protein
LEKLKCAVSSDAVSRECWVSSFILDIVRGFLVIIQILSFLVPMSFTAILSCYNYPTFFLKQRSSSFLSFVLFRRPLKLYFMLEIIKVFHVSKSIKKVSLVQVILDSFSWNYKMLFWYIWDSPNGVVEDSSLLGFGRVSFGELFPPFRRGFLAVYLRVKYCDPRILNFNVISVSLQGLLNLFFHSANHSKILIRTKKCFPFCW